MTTAVTASCAIVLDEEGNILAIKNKRGWDIPGGKVESDEKPEQTVIREVLEEASVVVGNPRLLHTQEFPSLGWLINYYLCNLVEIKPFNEEFETTSRQFKSIPNFFTVYGGGDLEDMKRIVEKAQLFNSTDFTPETNT